MVLTQKQRNPKYKTSIQDQTRETTTTTHPQKNTGKILEAC